MKTKYYVANTLLALLVLGSAGCLLPESGREELIVRGTVHQVNVGEVCWCVELTDGTVYELTNLPEEYKISGLVVQARIDLRPDLRSSCMIGQIATVLEIERTRN